MTTQELRSYIDRILGNSLRVLLPSYWWKRMFGAVVDEVEKVDTKVNSMKKSVASLSEDILGKTSTVRITDDTENNKMVVEAIAGGYYNNPVRIVYKNLVATYCTHYYTGNGENQQFFCYVVFNDRSSLISDNKQEKTIVIRLYLDGTKEVKTYFNPIITSVDSILSAGSSNPVRNSVITSALGGKANVSDITRLEGYIEPLVLFVPEIGKTLPRILNSKNGTTMTKQNLIERLKGNHDIHNPVEIAPRVVVFVYHETVNNGTIETDEEYLLTQHEGLNIRVRERKQNGYTWDCISADFVDFDGCMCTATIGGVVDIVKLDNEEVIAVDSVISDTSENPVQNKVIKEYVDGKIAEIPVVTVDSELSETSTNPVQNKVITSALNAKADKSYVDDAVANVDFLSINANYDTFAEVKNMLNNAGVTGNSACYNYGLYYTPEGENNTMMETYMPPLYAYNTNSAWWIWCTRHDGSRHYFYAKEKYPKISNITVTGGIVRIFVGDDDSSREYNNNLNKRNFFQAEGNFPTIFDGAFFKVAFIDNANSFYESFVPVSITTPPLFTDDINRLYYTFTLFRNGNLETWKLMSDGSVEQTTL